MIRTLMLGFLFVGMLGCSGEPKTTTVSGVVTYKNKPLSNGTISFRLDKFIAAGKIGDNGQYTIEKAPVGNVQVAVITYPATNVNQQAMGDSGPTTKKVSKKMGDFIDIPAHYKNAETSKLTCTVTESQSPITQNFDLK